MGEKSNIEKPLHFGLIGKKLVHSFSKRYFTEKFKELQLQKHTYSNLEFDDESALAAFLLDTVYNLRGFNITIPYKETIIPYLDSLQGEAKEIQAVNTVLVKKGKLIGYNTDVHGFLESIKPLLSSHHKKALILGSGGASKSIIFALESLDIKCKLVSRKKKSSDAILYEELTNEILSTHTIIVNCTPVGTFPNIEKAPVIPYQFLTKDHLVYDLVYNPKITRFLAKAKNQGASIQNGLLMLQLQADKAWEIWNS